jgi:transmembrane sensor
MADDRKDDIDWDKLDRYVRGEGDANERATLEQWVNEDPERRSAADAMRTIGSRANAPDTDRAFAAMQAKLGLRAPQPTPVRTLPRAETPTVPQWKRSIPVVAAAVLIGALGVALMQRRISEPAPSPARELTTAAGQRGSFQLADGSNVRLSPGSRLTVPAEFGSRTNPRRDVTLEGEAFFVVRHDSTRPFTVRTTHGTAEDLGTEFAVNVYPEIRGMRVAVREGRVAIHPVAAGAARADSLPSSGLVAMLEAGDVAQVDSEGGMSIARRQEMSALFAGADGMLVLRDVALRDAVPMLERWFSIHIRVDDASLLTRKVSGNFRDETPQAALRVIGLVLDRNAVWNGNEVRLR